MKVMKFGGTSVGSVESILRVKRIVEAQQEPVIVVVSALGGITDKLIQTSRMAASGDAAYENEFREIVSRHVEMVKRVFAEFDAQMTVQRQVGELLTFSRASTSSRTCRRRRRTPLSAMANACPRSSPPS